MPHGRLNVDHLRFGQLRWLNCDVEELALGVVADVDRNLRSRSPSSNDGRVNVCSSTNSRELTLNLMHAHDIAFHKCQSSEQMPAANVSAKIGSSPTRNRTRNFWLEARDDVRFTIEPFQTSGRRGSRTLITRRWHALAVRPGKPYPAAFRIVDVHSVNDS